MPLRALALCCFFLSGATGLLYQVLWARMLGGVIGNTHFSITAVVAVFMGGLALGSHLGGRAADRSRNPLRLYGILVLGVGILCLLVPLLISLAEPVFARLYGPWEGDPEALPLLLCRLLFCVTVLLGPTTCMGATLPVLSKFLTRKMSRVGMSIGRLYTVNTLGAFFGAALTGFFAIATLGLWGTTALAVIIDVLIGLVVIYAARGLDSKPATPPETSTDEGKPRPVKEASIPFDVRLCVFCFGVTGFANMLLQISWTKALIPTIGNSTYAFSLIVTLFILGIAIGGAVMSWLVDRLKRPLLTLGLIIAVKGLLVSATIPALGRFPLWGARLFDQADEPTYGGFLWIKLLMVAALVLPCTLLMGTVFPLVSKIRTLALERVGNAVGSAYFSNTMGSILGTLAAGFLFVPIFGEVFHTLYISAALNLLVGLALTWVATVGLKLPRAIALALTLLSLIPLWTMRPHAWDRDSDYWHPAIMSLGAYSYYSGAYYKDRGNKVVMPIEELIDQTKRGNEILFHKVGLHAEVTVVKHPLKGTALRISGKAEASVKPDGSYTQDLPHQIMAGHLPMILHPDPKRVLTLGLGCGVTLGTLTTHPVRLIDNLEISREVIEAARIHFHKANRGALDNHPKVRDVVGDGRNHLQFTTETYDVITSVPSNPWIAGIGNLFTTEFFEICRRRLAVDGIICHWIHKINLRSQDLKTVIRTFTTVFGEHAQLWDLGYDCLLIGSRSPLRLDAGRLRSLFENPQFRSDLAGLGIVDAVSLLRHYHMDTARMISYAGEGPRNTDSFPILEFECPKGLYGYAFDAYRDLTLADYSRPAGSWVTALGEDELASSLIRQEAFHHLELAEVLHKQLLNDLNRWGLRNLDKDKVAAVSRDQRAKMLQRVAEVIGHLDMLNTSFSRSPDNWLDKRGTLIGRLVTGSPGENLQDVLLGYHAGLAMNPKLQVNPLQVASHIEKALEYSDGKPVMTRDLSILLAKTCLRLQKPRRGIAGMQKIIDQQPNNAGVVELYGILHGAAGDHAKAESILKQALDLSGDDERIRGSIHHNLGNLYLQLENSERAIEHFQEALLLNPDNSQAKKILEALRSRDEP